MSSFVEGEGQMRKLEKSRQTALRDLDYAVSLAIQLLHELDYARAQVRSMSDEEDGRSIVSPCQALALDAAVANSHCSCANILSNGPKS